MRMMSFALTTPQILNRSKTVTRRIGWETLKPGELLQAVEKGQGIPKGGKVRKLAVIRVIDVSREVLAQMMDGLSPSYGREECIKEGFPELTPEQFVAMFCASHRIVSERPWSAWRRTSSRQCEPTDPVTRIEFEYVDEVPQ
jgi:hypothetical protein